MRDVFSDGRNHEIVIIVEGTADDGRNHTFPLVGRNQKFQIDVGTADDGRNHNFPQSWS